VIRPDVRVECGSHNGVNIHNRMGEPLCDSCREFHRTYQRDRRRRNGENSRTLVPLALIRQAAEQCSGDVAARLWAILGEDPPAESAPVRSGPGGTAPPPQAPVLPVHP
jgi:hypothetical protein